MTTHGPSQALNLGGAPTPYGDSFIALNLMAGAEYWAYYTEAGEVLLDWDDLALDARGWLTALPHVNGEPVGVYANVFYGDIMPAGQYILDWQGTGDVSVYQDDTVIGPNKLLIDFPANYLSADGTPQQDGITVLLNATDPAGTGDYVHDIRLYKAENADLIAAGERFDPAWVAQIDDFRMLRSHDWQFTNFPQTVDWGRNVYAADQAVWGLNGRGMPYEVIVDLANEVSADLWVNIPHTASDDYMVQAAAYLHDNFDPDMILQVEFSNEFFTTIFDQYQFFVDGGAANFGDAPSAAAQFYGTQLARAAAILDAEFGADNPHLKMVVTIDNLGFNSAEAELMLTAPASIAAGGSSPILAGVDVLATDGYLSWWGPTFSDTIYSWMDQPDGGFAAARDYLIAQLDTEVVPSWERGRALADKYGLEFQVYEGGLLLLNGNYGEDDPLITDFATRFSVTQEAADVYEALSAAWQEVGTGPFAWYSDVGRPGPWGYYGHWDSVTFAPQPRADVILDANENVAPWWPGGDRPASVFDNGHYDAGTNGPDKMKGQRNDDRLFGLDGDDQIKGKGGDDQIWGGLGADQLGGAKGRDVLHGGAGRDVLAGGKARDQIFGEAGADWLGGGAGADLMLGGKGRDHLSGGKGRDVLIGGAGDDALNGGRGGDHFVFQRLSDGGDTITRFDQGAGKSGDLIYLSGAGFGLTQTGALDAGAFQFGPGHLAQTADIRLIYDTRNHKIYFDADGAGATQAVLLANVQSAAQMDAVDFWVF